MSSTDQRTILVICPYPFNTAPSQRLKYEQYLPYLAEQGYTIEIHPFFTPQTYAILYLRGRLIRKIWGVLLGFWHRFLLLFRLPFVDGLYIHLHVTPVGPPILEWLFLKLSRRSIYDIDDMVHLLKTTDINRQARFFKSRNRIFMLMRAADHVITCTPTLDQLARSYNPNTTDISSTIDTERYQPANPYSNNKELVLGWSGSHTTAPYLHLLDQVLCQLAERHQFRLLVMGPKDFSLPGVEVDVVPWSAEVEIETFHRIDIGLYPLPNDEWVKGKSGLKALQYMALGIPVVASSVGCNDRVIQHCRTGFLVHTEEEWINSIERLMNDPLLRRRLGQQGRSYVESYFSVRSNRNRYLQIFNQVYSVR